MTYTVFRDLNTLVVVVSETHGAGEGGTRAAPARTRSRADHVQFRAGHPVQDLLLSP